MVFRENLRSELNFQDIKTKELSEKTGISKRTLDAYLAKNGNEPTAENAVKIAQALGVTVEYLVTGRQLSAQKLTEPELDLRLCKKYYNLLQKFDLLESASIKAIEQLAEQLK